MIKNNAVKKLVTISGTGAIPELGYITAPIINPTKIDVEILRKMVTRGAKVYEVNPKKPDEKILLTVKNVMTDNFVEPVKVPTKADTLAAQKIDQKFGKKNDGKKSEPVAPKADDFTPATKDEK